MARVNYVKECRAFTMLAAEERFTANEVVLWHALFELFNRKAEGAEYRRPQCGMQAVCQPNEQGSSQGAERRRERPLQIEEKERPDGFVEISNARLLPMTTFGVGDSGCETLRKTREKLQARGLIKYRKGRRNALTPAYCMSYFFAEKSKPAGSAETPVPVRPKGIPQGRRKGISLDKPLGKALGKPLGKPLAKTLDIPLNVNLNVNPNPGQKKLITGGTNPRAQAYTANRQPDDEKSTPAKQGAGMAYGCVEQNNQDNSAAYNDAWKTSAKARGAVAQRLLDQYDGLMDSSVAWESLCEVMADGLDPGTIERVIPRRFDLHSHPGRPGTAGLSVPVKLLCVGSRLPTGKDGINCMLTPDNPDSLLIARLWALVLCGEYRRFDLRSHPDSPDTAGLNAEVLLLSIESRLPMGKDGNHCPKSRGGQGAARAGP